MEEGKDIQILNNHESTKYDLHSIKIDFYNNPNGLTQSGSTN